MTKLGNYAGAKVRGDVNGRRRALGLLDTLLCRETNREKLYNALQTKFDEDPFWFFQKIVMPLLPKEQDHQAEVYLNPTLYQTDNVVFRMDQLTVPTISGYRVRLQTREGVTAEALEQVAREGSQRN